MKNELKYKVGKQAETYSTKMLWGYTTCASFDVKSIKLYAELIGRESLRVAYGKGCICEDISERFTSKINRLRGSSKISPLEFKDTSGVNFWQYTHPHCIKLTHYQKWCNQFLCDLEVIISLKSGEKCDLDVLTFISKKEACELQLSDIKLVYDRVCKLDVRATIEKEGCNLGAQVFLTKNYCKIENDFKVSEKECNIAHNAYVQKYGCDIDLTTFKSATKSYINC
jgi:hypothetical protein